MPIYEYQCEKCGVFEISQRITEAPITQCPTCHGKVARLISHTSFILKGSGWYATDYPHGNAKNTESSADTNGTTASSESASSAKAAADKPAAEKLSTEKVSTDKPAAAKAD
ncbi:MAG: FmdB family zinc ribbon protein [Candidatus Binataceae bacterium]